MKIRIGKEANNLVTKLQSFINWKKINKEKEVSTKINKGNVRCPREMHICMYPKGPKCKMIIVDLIVVEWTNKLQDGLCSGISF